MPQGGGRKRIFGLFFAVLAALSLYSANTSFIFAQKTEPVLSQPTIAVNPDIYYPQDEVLYIEGRAKPNSSIQIQFLKPGAKIIRLVTKSDQNGEWVLTERAPLEPGDWEVRARLVEGERVSEWSNPRVIKAIATGVTLGGITIKFTFLIILFVLAISVILYLLFRVRRETREKTGAMIEQDFSELKRDIMEELKHLASKRELSKEEQEHRDKLLRDLEHVEREIGRKLKDV